MNDVTTLSTRNKPEFLPVQDFTRFNKGVTCRTRCWVCEQVWSKTSTTYVNLVLDTEGKQKFVCDSCFSVYLISISSS